MGDFKVSVITPVYNAARYIQESVESAVHLEEVGEIILIEDGSPDNALEICKELSNNYEKVRLFQHEDGLNKGAGASRNLGIRKAQYKYIAFLDADDIYLPNRFKDDKEIFANDELDLIFNNGGKINSNEYYYSNENIEEIKNISNHNFLYSLISGQLVLHTNCLTVKKELVEKAKYFNENIRLHQDTHLWFKLTHLGNLAPGNLYEAVALTREHDQRRIYNRNSKSKLEFLTAVIEDFKKFKNVDKRFMKAIINRYLVAKSRNKLTLALNTAHFFWGHPTLLKNYIQ